MTLIEHIVELEEELDDVTFYAEKQWVRCIACRSLCHAKQNICVQCYEEFESEML